MLFALITSLKTSIKCVYRNKISFEAQGLGTRLWEKPATGNSFVRVWDMGCEGEIFEVRNQRFLSRFFCSFQLVIQRFIFLCIIITCNYLLSVNCNYIYQCVFQQLRSVWASGDQNYDKRKRNIPITTLRRDLLSRQCYWNAQYFWQPEMAQLMQCQYSLRSVILY